MCSSTDEWLKKNVMCINNGVLSSHKEERDNAGREGERDHSGSEYVRNMYKNSILRSIKIVQKKENA
jgi:hypothetical protein